MSGFSLRDDLLVTEIGPEVIVYDPLTHEAHSLNPSASDALRALRQEAPLEESPEAELAVALFQDKGFFKASQPLRPDRREVLLGLCRVAALPLITTLAVPTPAAASSTSVTEAQCRAGQGCGLPCSDAFFPNRVCGSFAVNGPCGCIDPATAVQPCSCLPS